MARDLNEVLDAIGMGTFQVVQLLLIGGVAITDGSEILVASSLLGALRDLWHFSAFVKGFMMACIFVGVFAGGLCGGYFADAYGRRKSVLFSYLGIIIFGASTAATQGPVSMLTCRFLFGAAFGFGMAPGISLQIESCPAKWRGHIINLGGLWFTAGEVYTAFLLIIFMPDLTDPTGHSWRWVTLLSFLPGMLLFPFALLLLQESPHYLSLKGQHSEAIHTVQYIAHMNNQADKVEDLNDADPDQRLEIPSNTEDMTAALVQREGSRRGSRASNASESTSARELGMQQKPQPTAMERLQIAFGAEYRSIVIGGAYLCFLGNFLFYGLTYSLPQIFKTLNRELSPSVEVLIISLCDFPGVLLGFFLIYSKRFGHRDGLMMLATCASVLSLTLISIDHGSKWLFLGLPSAYLAKWVASAFFTLSYVYLSEIFPSIIRTSSLALCIAAGRFGSIFAPLLFELLRMDSKDLSLGRHAPFLIMNSILCCIGIVVIKATLYFELKNAPLQNRCAPSQILAETTDSDEEAVGYTGQTPEECRRSHIESGGPAPAG